MAKYSGCWDRARPFSTAVRTGFRRKGRWRVWGRLGIGSQKSEVAPNGAWPSCGRALEVGVFSTMGSIKISGGRKMRSVSPQLGKIDGRDSVLVALEFFILVKVTLVEFHPLSLP